MPKFADYYYVDVKAEATINGAQVPVCSLEINYRVNEIPTARVMFPVGREVAGSRTGRVADTLGIISKLEPFTPIEIRIKATPQPGDRAAPSGKDRGFPSGSMFRVFKGFMSAPSTEKSAAGSASIGVDCFGLPAALAGTTQFAVGTGISAAPANGSSYSVVRLGGGATSGMLNDAIRQFCTNASSDLWSGGLQPIMQIAAQGASTWFNRPQNDFALQALKRINVGGVLPVSKLSLDHFNLKGPLDRSLAVQLCNGFWSVWRDGSDEGDLWDVLMAFQQYFRFHFVPAVEEDSVAPISLNLRADPWRTLDPSEYWVTGQRSVFDQKFYSYLTEVGVYAKSFSSSPAQDKAATSRVVGQALLKGKPGAWAGRMKVVEAPPWILPLGSAAKNSLNSGSFVPDKGNPEGGQPPSESQGSLESRYFRSGIGDGFAGAILHDTLFAHRKMNLEGRLRFDIAPGSTINVNTLGEVFAGGKDTLFAVVEGVRIRVGNQGGNSYATTGLDLTNVRTQQEQSTLAVAQHPIFNVSWRGGKLLPY